ncbi:MAG: hypothetical protein V4563_14100 [Pseudomonadota bacterium]
MSTNYKTTIAGAFSALGTTLMGVGVVPQLAGTPSKFLTVTATVGFVCTAIGQFLGHLFSADAKTVDNLKQAVAINTESLRTGDTSMLNKADVLNPAKDETLKG